MQASSAAVDVHFKDKIISREAAPSGTSFVPHAIFNADRNLLWKAIEHVRRHWDLRRMDHLATLPVTSSAYEDSL